MGTGTSRLKGTSRLLIRYGSDAAIGAANDVAGPFQAASRLLLGLLVKWPSSAGPCEDGVRAGVSVEKKIAVLARAPLAGTELSGHYRTAEASASTAEAWTILTTLPNYPKLSFCSVVIILKLSGPFFGFPICI